MRDGQARRQSSGRRQGLGAAAVVCVLLAHVSLPVLACSSTADKPEAPSAEAKALAEYDLAREAFGAGRLREAYGHVQDSLEIDPANPDVHYLGAVILLKFCAADETSTDCRFQQAERHAREALKAAPEMRDAKNALGVILVHQNKYDEAIAVLKPLAEDLIYTSPETAWGNLGWAYLLRGNIDEAIDALRRALAAQPRFCVGNYRLGLAFEKKGELALAQEAFTRALETDWPECQRLQDAFAARARVATRLGLQEQARADLERCLEIAAATPIGKRCAAERQALP